MNEQYLYLCMQLCVCISFVSATLLMSVLFGKKATRNDKHKNIPYECGMLPAQQAPNGVQIKFYLVAIIFVLFDLEVVFLYPFAVHFQDLIKTNAHAFYSILTFIGILTVAYIYALKKGLMQWNK